MRIQATLAALVFSATLLGSGSASAQTVSSQTRPPGLEGVGIEQRLDAKVPLDLTFVDEKGQAVELSRYFGRKPVLLTLVYYECPMLCTEILNGVLRATRAMNFDIGREFEVVTVSIDPGETPQLAAEKKDYYVRGYGRAGGAEGWHFLTGRQEQIQRLADAVGFQYRYDAATDLFSHASSIILLTPEGRVSRYFFGVEYSPRDLRLGMVEASQNKIGTPIDQALLYCFHYDPATGKYSVVIMNVLRLAGVATVLAIASFILLMLARERRAAASKDAVSASRPGV